MGMLPGKVTRLGQQPGLGEAFWLCWSFGHLYLALHPSKSRIASPLTLDQSDDCFFPILTRDLVESSVFP